MPQTNHDFLLEMAAKGGSSTYAKYGKEHYRKAAKKRWENAKRAAAGSTETETVCPAKN